MYPNASNLEYMCVASDSRVVISAFSDDDEPPVDYSDSRAPFCPLQFVPSVYLSVIDKITEAGKEGGLS